MSFQPKSGNHAIVEVVFGLLLTRNFAPPEIDALAATHDRWREELPRVERPQVIQFILGSKSSANVQGAGVGVTFERVKPDGTPEWRLRAEGANVYVNCLDYEGWPTVWPRVKRYLQDACDVSLGNDNEIRGLVLQYIDVFEWVGKPDEYQLEQLFDRDSGYLPNSLWDKGPLWHLYQGWFRTEGIPAPGRLLEKIHIDAVSDNNAGKYTVRMDTFLSLELEKPINRNTLFDDSPLSAEQLFSEIHDRAKNIVGAYLTSEMTRKIGLDA